MHVFRGADSICLRPENEFVVPSIFRLSLLTLRQTDLQERRGADCGMQPLLFNDRRF
jgi:hypothetical protein